MVLINTTSYTFYDYIEDYLNDYEDVRSVNNDDRSDDTENIYIRTSSYDR